MNSCPYVIAYNQDSSGIQFATIQVSENQYFYLSIYFEFCPDNINGAERESTQRVHKT